MTWIPAVLGQISTTSGLLSTDDNTLGTVGSQEILGV